MKLPPAIYTSLLVLGILGVGTLLFLGRAILVPLLFALLLAIVVSPVAAWLTAKGLHRVLGITLALLLALAVLVGIGSFMSIQVTGFLKAIPELQEGLRDMVTMLAERTAEALDVETDAVRGWFAELRERMSTRGAEFVTEIISDVGVAFALFLLLPVYAFLFLYYQPLLLTFVAKLFPAEKHKVAADVLVSSEALVQRYLLGLLLEALIVAALNTTGLLLLGVQYAVLLGVTAALMNLVPYIGGLVATGVAMLVALATQGAGIAFGVLGLFLLVQFIDNNYLVPRIVASKVKLNALVSIVAVLIGGALWGVGGMFLAIPLTATVKVICDRVPRLQAYGYLLGDDMKRQQPLKLSRQKRT